MTDEPGTCAVWYVRYGTAGYKVQFRHGQSVAQDDWPAYQAEEKRRLDQVWASASRQPIIRPTRTVTNPFTGKPVQVDADDPDWLGMAP